MIGLVKGTVDSIRSSFAIVDTGGVGYKVLLPLSLLSKIKIGDTIKVYTYTYVREDALDLFGFESYDDLLLFELFLTLNQDQKNLIVGSTIYLPPSFIKSSSGHIFEVSGKIILMDNKTNWQLAYGGDPKGPGIVFPGYWFKDVGDLSSYKPGDCVTILFDDGVKVYSVKKS